MREIWEKVLLAVVVQAAASVLGGGTDAARAVEAHVLAEFDMRDFGDHWRVPVTIGKEQYNLLLDTGASCVVFDKRLRAILGDPVAPHLTFQTPTGALAGGLFAAPRGYVGTLPINPKILVVCLDLRNVKDSPDDDLGGILGCSFLRQYVVEFDFEKARLRFLSAPEDHAGCEVLLQEGEDIRPYCVCSVSGQLDQIFVVDTGCSLPLHVNLRRGLFDRLLHDAQSKQNCTSAPELIPLGYVGFRTATGPVTNQCGALRQIDIGGHRVEHVYALRGTESSLGLRLLSRFLVTIDFPKKRMYLRPIAGAENDELEFGFLLRRNGRRTYISEVRGDTRAWRSGLRPFDEVLSIEGVETISANVFALRRLVGQCGSVVRMTIKRGDEVKFISVQREWEKKHEERP